MQSKTAAAAAVRIPHPHHQLYWKRFLVVGTAMCCCCHGFQATQRRQRQSPTVLWRRKNHRGTTPPTELSWESFDFSDSPKWDRRFQAQTLTEEEQPLHPRVANAATDDNDEEDDTNLPETAAAWRQLDPAVIQRGITALTPFVRPARIQTMQRVFQQRTSHTHFLFEHPINPSNVWACLRTLDAFGIQHVHIVVDDATFTGSTAGRAQKRGLKTAVGSAQWLSMTQYRSTAVALEALQHHRLVVADLQPGAVDIRNVEWAGTSATTTSSDDDDDDDRPICIVMGNEERGVTDDMRAAADVRFSLPMVGFAESFNLSVATAITLAHLSAASSNGNVGPIRPGDLSEEERNCLLFKGLLQSVANRRVADAVLQRAGVRLPHNLVQRL